MYVSDVVNICTGERFYWVASKSKISTMAMHVGGQCPLAVLLKGIHVHVHVYSTAHVQPQLATEVTGRSCKAHTRGRLYWQTVPSGLVYTWIDPCIMRSWK